MAGDQTEPEASSRSANARSADTSNKRRRSESPIDGERGAAQPSSFSSQTKKSRADNENDVDDLPQPYDARKLQPATKRQRSTSPGVRGGGSGDQPPPRKLKKPGARRAVVTEEERERIRQRALERERENQRQAANDSQRAAGNHDVVRAHYNSVPERGREWRKTDSKIKGLRSFNNWVKSCIIQKFAPDEDHAPGAREEGRSSGRDLLVLDLGCGKGGDLGKWQQSPQRVELYVGLDPAEISIEQARDRYHGMKNRGGGRGGRGGRGGYNRRPPPDIFEARFHAKDCFGETIEDVDIVQQVGFTHSTLGGSHGFDVVSMMFCMHYAFETEAKARQMLRNVSGALKKGGRLIGCIPNSDVISSKVEDFNKRMEEKKRLKAESTADAEAAEDGELEEGEAEATAEWGNSIYKVRFPGKTPVDGVFRPPYGWKYNFFLDEAVEEVPEYVVPWEAFRALAEDYNLELQYHKNFTDVWEQEKDDRQLGPLSERMGVRERGGGKLLVSPEEMEAASFYVAFCFYKV